MKQRGRMKKVIFLHKKKMSEELLPDRGYSCVANTYDHRHDKSVCSRDYNNVNENILVHRERQCV
jgi:hypothetical protein